MTQQSLNDVNDIKRTVWLVLAQRNKVIGTTALVSQAEWPTHALCYLVYLQNQNPVMESLVEPDEERLQICGFVERCVFRLCVESVVISSSIRGYHGGRFDRRFDFRFRFRFDQISQSASRAALGILVVFVSVSLWLTSACLRTFKYA